MTEDSWRSDVLRDLGSAAQPVPHAPAAPAAEPAVAWMPIATSATRGATGDGLGRIGPERHFDPAVVAGAVRHGDGPARRVLRWAHHLVGTSGEDRALELAARGARRPVTTGRRILVSGVSGGSGATTMALLLGTVFAVRRNDQVLAVDTDPDGSLSWRLSVSGQPLPADLSELLAAGTSPSPADLDALPRTASGLWVLPAPVTTSAGAVRSVSRAVGRFFGVTVLDCAGGLDGPASPVAAEDSHAAVLAAPATLDGVRRARLTFDRLAGASFAALSPHRVVVVLVAQNPATEGLHIGKALRELRQDGTAAFLLPYDRHLAAGGQFEPRRLGQGSLLAATTVAAEALSRALIP